MDIQSNGKIIVAGNFSKAGFSGILRLNSDGTIDNTFIPGIVADWYTKTLVDKADNIYITNGPRLFKLSANGEAASGFPISTNATNPFKSSPSATMS